MVNSEQIVSEQEERTNREIQQLLRDIDRIGDSPGSCKFGPLFDDDQVANYYEALVGTLKTAKKRGLIDFKGQMLLKGMHDGVVITICDKGAAKRSGGSPTPVTPPRGKGGSENPSDEE